MRYCLLICCLVGLASLGCGSSSEPRAARGVAADSNSTEKSALPGDLTAQPGDLDGFHGSAARADTGTGPEVRLDAVTFTAPQSWKRTKPSSSFYQAEFTLPHVEKDAADGQVTVSLGSGPVEANLDVFMGQFDSANENPKQEKEEIGGFQVTLVDVSGSYTGKHGQSAPTAPLTGYRMMVAVIPVDGQLHFVKAVGPQQTIAANVEAFNTFVRSVQRRKGDDGTASASAGSGNEVHVKPLSFTAPAAWKRTEPRSPFIQAEFAIPHVDKDTADGRLTVSVVAGSVKDNVDRWKGQFGGTVERPRQEEAEVAGLKATLVDFTGTFGEQAGMSGPVVNRPDYRMIAAIFPIGDQLYVIKAVGPRQTMTANVDAINFFVGSLKREQ